jgi:NAD(P)-dependent dehydrogenase (short-subunit alcohol dehydrogenase family)
MAKTVLITGSSSGIGRATAQLFAARGWNVSATARNPGSLETWKGVPNVLALGLDVTNEASIGVAVSATAARFGTIDVLVNNAGYGLFGPLEGIPPGQFEAQFRTNVFGAVAMIRHVLPLMRVRHSGTIVNVSSAAGRFGSAFLSPYTATKYAIEGLSESLRFELKAFGVRVKLVEPGHFKSDFLTRNLQWSEHIAYEPQVSNMKAWVARSVDGVPGPEEVAEVIYKAATDHSGRLRYLANARLLLAMHAILPDLLWRWMVGAGMNRPPKGRKPGQGNNLVNKSSNNTNIPGRIGS